jgi:exosome complex component RRP42
MLVGGTVGLSSRQLLSSSEREYISEGIDQDIRADGRRRVDFRPFEVELNSIPQAIGSARLKLGQTDVLVGIKADIGRPSMEAPNKGTVNCAVDCSAGVGFELEERQHSERNAELSSVLASILCDSGSLNLEELAIVSGKHCWVLYIDVLVLDFDGNVVDAMILAVRAALGCTRLPSVSIEEGETTEVVLSSEPQNSKSLSIENLPVSVTLCQMEKSYIADPSVSEEICSSAAMIIAVQKSGRIAFTRKMASGSLDPSVIMDMVQTAQRIASEMIVSLDNLISTS